MEAQVVVIGGGITGTGVLRDLAMRGIKAILVEKGDLVNGCSAGFQGLLHSGARYASNDPASAVECIKENNIVRQIAPHCVEEIGGIFIQLEEDDPAFANQWFSACHQNGIQAVELDSTQLLREEANLSPKVSRAFRVPDGALDGFRLVQENALCAQRHGAEVFTYTEAVGLICSGGKVSGVKLRNRNGEEEIISCQVVINAAGPWAGKVAALAGVELMVIPNKGSMLVFNHRLAKSSIQLCQPPGDGGVLIPHHTVSIYGTTSANVDDPESNRATYQEVCKLLDLGSKLIPAMRQARILRAFAGVRPLYQDASAESDEQSRAVTRDFFVIDHSVRHGLSGMVSIVGGKFTTYRLMAEKTVDLVAAKLGNTVSCRTALELLSGSAISSQVQKKNLFQGQMICECEQVSEGMILQALQAERSINLNDLRRRTRLGMGTCQGTFCSYRALGLLQKAHDLSAEEIRRLLTELLAERWKGMTPALWGQTLRETELMRGVYSNILNIEGLEESRA